MGENPSYIDVTCCLIHYAEHLGGLKWGSKEFADRVLNRGRHTDGKNHRLAELVETQTTKKKKYYINYMV